MQNLFDFEEKMGPQKEAISEKKPAPTYQKYSVTFGINSIQHEYLLEALMETVNHGVPPLAIIEALEKLRT